MDPVTAPSAREVHSDESAAWDEFVSNAPNGNVLQSWGWGEFKRRHGWRPVRLVVEEDAAPRAAALVLLRSMAGVSIAYVPRGPVVPANRPELYGPLLDGIHWVARASRSIFLKIEPNEPQEPQEPGTPGGPRAPGRPSLDAYLRGRGFARSSHTPQPRATLFADLDPDPDAQFTRVKEKTRANVRKAERRGVSVRSADGDDDVRRFHELMTGTAERGGFGARGVEYYRDVLDELRPRGHVDLLLGELEGRVVAGVMAYAYGVEGGGLYSASNADGKRAKANDLLQWRAIRWCIERGCRRYDLWGIPDEVADRIAAGASDAELPSSGGMWGLYHFKRGFGDRPVSYIGAYDYPYIKPLYLLWSRLRRNRGM